MAKNYSTQDLDRYVVEFSDAVKVAADTKGYRAGSYASGELRGLCEAVTGDQPHPTQAVRCKMKLLFRAIGEWIKCRRLAPCATAAIVLLALLGTGGSVSSYKPEMDQRDGPVFKDKTTGVAVYSTDETQEGAASIVEIAGRGSLPLHSIERWEVKGKWHWIAIYFDEADSTWIGTTRHTEKDNSDKEFTHFMIDHGVELHQLADSGRAEQIGMEEREVNGTLLYFTKWLIKSEGLPPVIFWDGVPVSR